MTGVTGCCISQSKREGEIGLLIGADVYIVLLAIANWGVVDRVKKLVSI
jgi:hypothetical protein